MARSSCRGEETAAVSALGPWGLFWSTFLALSRAARKSSSRRREMSFVSLIANHPFTMQSQAGHRGVAPGSRFAVIEGEEDR